MFQLTSKQKLALDKAPPAARKSMRKMFQKQAMGTTDQVAPAKTKTRTRTQPTASAPRAEPIRRQMGQAVPNYMDPMCKVPMPASLCDGKALAHTSLISRDFKLPKYEPNTDGLYPGPTVLIVTNVGSTSTVGVMVSTVELTGGDVRMKEDGVKQVMFRIPTLAGPETGGHPTAGRAMKYGVTVINNSNALKRGGRVTYLNTFQRLPDVVVGGSEATPNYYWDHVIEAVKAAPDRRRINGNNLATPQQCVGAVVDNVRYHEFNRWTAAESKNQFLNHVLDREESSEGWMNLQKEGDSSRPMSTVVFVFDPTDEPQDYSVTIRAAFYTRWPLTTVPGQSMTPIPTAATPFLNKIHEAATQRAGEMAQIAAGAVGGGIGDKLAAAAGAAAEAMVPIAEAAV